MVKAITTALVLLLAEASYGDTMMLAEFGRTNLTQELRFPLLGVQFGWATYGLSSTPWKVPIQVHEFVGQLPMTIVVPVGTVFVLDDISPQPTVMNPLWTCNNCYQPPVFIQSFTADELFAGIVADPTLGYGLFGSSFVPQLGPGFTGYEVTRAELTVTDSSSPTWGMVIRLYGDAVAVPEPARWVLCLIAGLGWLLTRC